jgi:hypothetical protein
MGGRQSAYLSGRPGDAAGSMGGERRGGRPGCGGAVVSGDVVADAESVAGIARPDALDW